MNADEWVNDGSRREHRAATRGVPVFLGIVYALAIGVSLVVALTGGYQSRLAFAAGVSAMFIPAIASLVMKEKVKLVGRHSFPAKYVPIALLLMPAVMHAVMLPVAAAVWGGLPWEGWRHPQSDGLYHTPASRGWGVLTTQGLAARLALNIVVGLIANSALAFFEEVGWRAWMLPRMICRMGAPRGILGSAVIWALWHVPFALSGIHHLDGVPMPLTALIMPVVITGAGLVIGWLWVQTESIWLVALAHGALNNWGQYAFKFMGETGAGQAGDVVVLAAGGLALLITGTLLLVFRTPEGQGSGDG